MSELWRGYKELSFTASNPDTCPHDFEDMTAVGWKRCKYCGKEINILESE